VTTLEGHRRGDTFVYSFALGNGWIGSDFTGGVKFTLRDELVEASVTTDDDAVDQASVATGEITFVGATGTITIAASRTTAWPTGRLHWDMQGVISGSPAIVYTIDSGTLPIEPDVTRSI
jgi:preprotein translocase subunit SecF